MRCSMHSCLLAGAFVVFVCAAPHVPAANIRAAAISEAGQGRWVDLGDGRVVTPDPGAEAVPVKVMRSSADRLDLAFGIPGFRLSPIQLSDGRTYTRVAAEGATFVEAGQPAVPAFGRWILIPKGTRARVEVEPGEPVVIRDLDLEPMQPPRGQPLDAPEPPFARDEAVFGRDADSPGAFARLESTKIMRGQPCTVLWLYPVQYNPVQRTLSAYPDLRVTVSFEGEVEPLRAGLKDRGFEAAQRQLAINAEAVLAAQEAAGERLAAGSEKAAGPPERQTGWDYIIFSRLEFAAAGDLLAAWKRKIGFRPIHLWYSGVPSATDLKAILQSWYDNNDVPPRYVVIIGDADDIPCFYVTAHPYEGLPGGQGTQGFIGTDLYYATLDGADEMPDIGYGRMPVDSESQALAWVERIIAYEQDPPVYTNFYDRVALAAYFQDGEYPFPLDGYEDQRFVQTAEDLAKFFSEAQYGLNKSANRIYYAEPGVNPTNWSSGVNLAQPNFGGGPAGDPNDPIPSYLLRPGFPWDGDATDIAGALEPGGGGSGSFLLVHRDHGSRQHWSHPFFYPVDISNLDITWGESPVIWSVNCQTGWFDNETDFPYITPAPGSATATTEESFVEFFANYCSQGGPVGLVGATRISDTIYNDRLTWGMVDAIWPAFIGNYPPIEFESIYEMGDVLNFAKGYLMTTTPDDDWRLTHMEEYHWFGDPAMEIRTEHPDWLSASYPTIWPYMGVAHDFAVHVENGSGPVQNARVCLSHPENTWQHWTGWTNASGNVTFSGVVTEEPGHYDLVATSSNNVPWLGSVFSAGADLIFADGFESGDTTAW